MTDPHAPIPPTPPRAPAVPSQQAGYVPAMPMSAASVPAAAAGLRGGRQFAFDGGAATYLGTGILALVITVFTLGICYPFALVLRERWRAKHSYIDGHRLEFTGSAWGLFGNWLKWFALIVITIGIYGFWVGPRIARWKWEHTGFAEPVHAVRNG